MRRAVICWLLLAPALADARAIAFLAHPKAPKGRFETQAISQGGSQFLARPATQLVVRDLGSGEEAIPVDIGVFDFSVSLDGGSIFYSRVLPGSHRDLGGCDIFRLDLATGDVQQLTDGPGWNMQPVEIPGGDVCFLSSRDGWAPTSENFLPILTIYRMDATGRQQRRIWHAGLGGAYGLALGPDGRLYFSSGEGQGDKGKWDFTSWAIWSVNPDGGAAFSEMPNLGRIFNPVLDWPVITTDRSLVCASYYGSNIYGALLRAPAFIPDPLGPPTKYGSPQSQDNPGVLMGGGRRTTAYERRGMSNLVRWMTHDDVELRNPAGETIGVASHPWPIPGNGILFTWIGDRTRENTNLGIYSLPTVASTVDDHHGFTLVVDEPGRHEWMGKLILPAVDIWGVTPPAVTTPIDGRLPPGSPWSVVGTSDCQTFVETLDSPSFGITRLIRPADNEVEYCRVIGMEPTRRAVGPWYLSDFLGAGAINNEGLGSAINERVGIYGDIPVRKYRGPHGELYCGPDPPAGYVQIMRTDGLPDTSWQALIPANQPWHFQLLNRKKEVIWASHGRTWLQNIPREAGARCQGCHAHWEPDPLPFAATFAATREYYDTQRRKLDRMEKVIWDRDVAPLGLDVPMTPWGVQLADYPYFEPGPTRPFQTGRQSFDDIPGAMPQALEIVRAWIDTGMLHRPILPLAGTQGLPVGAELDTMPPTLTRPAIVRDANDNLVIYLGACDPGSGLDPTTLYVELDGADVTDGFFWEQDADRFRWTAGALEAGGYLAAEIADMHGNYTRHETLLGVADAAFPPPRGQTIEELLAYIEWLLLEIARLKKLLGEL